MDDILGAACEMGNPGLKAFQDGQRDQAANAASVE